MIVFGFALGLMSALFFAFYMVPQKLVKVDNTTFLWTMGCGVLLTSLLAYTLAGFPNTGTWHEKGAGLLCGAVWGIGTLAFAASISRIGLVVATPIKNTTGVLGTLVGLVFLQEWRTTNPWLGVSGSVLIVASAMIIGKTRDRSVAQRHTVTGIGFALLAALCYASYLYPMKLAVARIGYWAFTPWMALGILSTALLAVLFRQGGLRDLVSYTPRTYGMALLGGVAWAIALFSLTASMGIVDLSVAWALAQLNTIPAVFLGILIFREMNWTQHRVSLWLGLCAATLGTVLLGMAK